jgi:hypothetical protein
MTKLLMISLHFLRFMKFKLTVFSRLLKKAILIALWTKASLCVKSSLLEQSVPRTPGRLKASAISAAKNLFNLRNLRLIKELCTCMALYICRVSPTDVVSALQIHLFLCKTNPISNKLNERKLLSNKELRTKSYEL